jgi:hypothetical protein
MEKRIWTCFHCDKAMDPRHCFVYRGESYCPHCYLTGNHKMIADETLAKQRQELYERGIYQ